MTKTLSETEAKEHFNTTLKDALIEGEESGDCVSFDIEEFIKMQKSAG